VATKKRKTDVVRLPAPAVKSKKQTNSPQKKDELDREVGIQLHFQGFDVALKTTSRAIAAVDRLLGGFFGIPAAYAEGWRAQDEEKFRTAKSSVVNELLERVVSQFEYPKNKTSWNWPFWLNWSMLCAKHGGNIAR
jgi:hypothetical protein